MGGTMRVVVGASRVMIPPLAARMATAELLGLACNARLPMLLLDALPALLLVHGREKTLHGACNKHGCSFEAA